MRAMNAFRRMDATPPENESPQLAAEARRARVILFVTMAAMIALPVLLFLAFHT
jgi:hypothetical protein